jgi:hypothetical protein
MNTRNTYLGALAGLIVVTATLALTDGGKAAAQSMKPLLVQIVNTVQEPVPVATVLPPADRVLLEWRGGSGDPCPEFTLPLARILPDGTLVSNFAVPAGRMLVVTDVSGVVRQGAVPWTAGFGAVLNVGKFTFPPHALRVYEPLTSAAVSAEVAFVREHLQSGFVVGPNINVCVTASVQHGSGGGVASVTQARVTGYLIAE